MCFRDGLHLSVDGCGRAHRGPACVFLVFYFQIPLSHLLCFITVFMIMADGYTTFIERRINVSTTSWHFLDINATLYKRFVPAGWTWIWHYTDEVEDTCAGRKDMFVLWSCIRIKSDVARAITKTCLYNFDPLKPHFYIVKLGLQGYTLLFSFLLKNIDCGYSLELPRRSRQF